jgi:hypothetical protein
MAELVEGRTYRVRYIVKIGTGGTEAREGSAEVKSGRFVLIHRDLQGQSETHELDSAELVASDDPDVDFIYMGTVIAASF